MCLVLHAWFYYLNGRMRSLVTRVHRRISNTHQIFWRLAGFVTGLALVAVNPAHAADGGIAGGPTASYSIAFSNSYAGSDFRKVMVRNWQEIAVQAQKDGLIREAPVVSANNSASEQAAHIQDMIVKGANAIVILAASDTALNGVIRDACNAGIVVVVMASLVTEPCVYTVDYNWSAMGRVEMDYIAGRLKGNGTLLEIRGIAGDATDKNISDGIRKAASDYPGLKFAKTVYGNWTASVARKEVALALPSLPSIDAVATQGGDGYGAAMAFKAAGRPLPIIVMGNRQDELALWKQERDANGYETVSVSASPSVSQVGFWVAQQILAGKQVPKFVEVPLVRIDGKDLDAWLATMPVGGAANPSYDQASVAAMIDAAISNTAPPTPLPEVTKQ
ncbi:MULTISPECIES: ABC transporter substrate-binding protein [unclassified Pseudomonas]|uniref:ABC transporter substrate-binding protein n=1 Tax=unclassified Pseudomonas TaxID=196821 RepID=UPI0008985AA4|nr:MULTISPECIES: ABC transporter substrate-binding protein [unclassified Pseudomonas]SDW46555.1 ribose transport system substrate-binding protein [Pseudomonas sp. NFACC08-1]SEI48600.1 ribose transport system substrate-binding protein [Pseudomonas sp. NFACC07-1]SFL06337.1 ribose transport system substrate-binding protein [Pseudomonas sp. NFACC46-3]